MFPVLAACTSAPAPVIDNYRAPEPAVPQVRLVAAHWRFAASAELANGSMHFRYCCTNHGSAETQIALPAGSYWIGVTHRSDCDQAMSLLVRDHDKHVLSQPAVFGPEVGIIPLEVPPEAANESLSLQLFAIGGKSCCGESTVEQIEIVRL